MTVEEKRSRNRFLIWATWLILVEFLGLFADRLARDYNLNWVWIMGHTVILFIVLTFLLGCILRLVRNEADEVDQLRKMVDSLGKRDDARQEELEIIRRQIKALQQQAAYKASATESRVTSLEKRLGLIRQTLGFPANFASRRQLPLSRLDAQAAEIKRLEAMILFLALLCQTEQDLTPSREAAVASVFRIGDVELQVIKELVARDS